MKKNINKTSADFEKMLNEEFQNNSKAKSLSTTESQDSSKKKDDKEYECKKIETNPNDSSKKTDSKNSGDDKK